MNTQAHLLGNSIILSLQKQQSIPNINSHGSSNHNHSMIRKEQINAICASEVHPSNQHVQAFEKLQNFIQQVGESFKKQIQFLQTAKLQQFKDDLLKTKSQFEQLNQKRNDNALKNCIYGRKKMLQKQCNGFLQKSMEVSRMYDGLKAKISEMIGYQEQLQHESQYLKKKIRIASKKNEQLKNQFQRGQRQYRKKVQMKSLQGEKVKNKQISVLGQRINNRQTKQSINQNGDLKSSLTKIHNQNTRQRLIDKIENAKQFMDSIVFQPSALQTLFQQYDPKEYKQERKKIELMEQMFQKQEVKKLLYYLLFKQDDRCDR